MAIVQCLDERLAAVCVVGAAHATGELHFPGPAAA